MEELPECRRIIEAVDNPMALWIDLSCACEDAYKKQDEDLIRRFYDFARWCWKSPSADVRTAVACGFYEHLPMRPVIRRDMPRRFTRGAFIELREVFRYHLSPEDAAAFEREFFEAEKKFVKDVL
ncbi:MAG: hypothetical protein DME23_04740 [Verrucomicrobia bacterium]|nr:MAG: hypothetical protein DME23_04740 [Verrucomicrobiota bacterium]